MFKVEYFLGLQKVPVCPPSKRDFGLGPLSFCSITRQIGMISTQMQKRQFQAMPEPRGKPVQINVFVDSAHVTVLN